MRVTVDNLLDRLRERPLLCDGAMGTELFAAGLPLGGCGLAWNIDNPMSVLAVHRAYIAAGCDILTTNTFCGTHAAASKQGQKDATRTIAMNHQAARLARQAAEQAEGDLIVLGNAGPASSFLPEHLRDPRVIHSALFTQFVALHEGGADGVAIETVSDPDEMRHAITAARDVDDWLVMASYAFKRDEAGRFVTLTGASVRDAIATAIDAGAHVVGGNCGASLNLEDNVVLASELVAAAGDVPVVLQPNAGTPTEHHGKLTYAMMPEHFAKVVPRITAAGVRVVGGCCGTTPAHVQAMAEAMRMSVQSGTI